MFSTADHWRYFSEFARWNLAARNIAPQLAMLSAMQHDAASPAERVWRAGCYIGVYNVPYGQALWRAWPWNRVEQVTAIEEGKIGRIDHYPEVGDWLTSNWSKITTRVERRCVRRPDWMTRYLVGFTSFVRGYPQLQHDCTQLPPHAAYDLAWDYALKHPFLGRYVALRLLEYLRRHENLAVDPPDMRPKGGWSPRRQLSLLWEAPEVDSKNDSPELLARINQLVTDTIVRLDAEQNVKLSIFQLQLLLCEYRESWEGARQYPGRGLDSELMYGLKAEKDWGAPCGIWAARRTLFPHQHLGEIGGWQGPREGPASALARHGYTWSDLQYDWAATRDWAAPACRAGVKPPVAVERTQEARKRSAKKTPRVPRLRGPRLYTIIEDKLFMAPNWLRRSVEECAATVSQHAITVIANFWQDDPRLATLARNYRHQPLQDGKTIPSDLVITAEILARRLVAFDERLLCMCHGGRNRSGLVAALVVRRLSSCTGAQALKVVRAGRPGAVANPYFADWLSSLPAPEMV